MSGSSSQATHASKRPPISFADLFSGPSLQESAASVVPGAGRAPAASRLPAAAKISNTAAPSAPKPGSKGITTISFGSMLRGVPMKSMRQAAQGAHRVGGYAGAAGSRGSALQQQLQQHGTLPRRGKLRRENAQKKQRLSHVKRIVLQVSFLLQILEHGAACDAFFSLGEGGEQRTCGPQWVALRLSLLHGVHHFFSFIPRGGCCHKSLRRGMTVMLP